MSAAQPELPPRPADDVLPSKTLPPAGPGWVIGRSRIEERIAVAPLTVVTGPPGAGKTTAVASWAAGPVGPVAWVTLDRYDGQWAVFWATVVSALGCAGVEFRRALPAPGRTDNHAFMLRLAAELAAREPPVTLVLDDLQQVTGHDVDDGLQYLIRNTRPGLRVVICSRADPVLSLHHYRLAGELTEIRAAELAFTVDEARLLMAQHGVTLPDGPIERLTELTEGWAAGLRMAALSLQEEPDPEQLVKKFASEDSAIAGYLMDEVLNKQPPQHRDLLLKSSILDRVSAGLAVELTGDERAGHALGVLAHANAFVEACRPVLALDPADGGHHGPPDAADPVIVEELSGREREVLRLLAGMLTTAEVAQELYISVNTVKSHLKSIYRKLATGRRSEAVRRAKQLRMI